MMNIKLPIMNAAAKVIFGTVMATSIIANGALASELRLASGVPPLHPAHAPLYTDFAELLPEYSNGRLSGRLFGTEITTLANMRASILSGLVEVGLFLPSYFPADLPNFNLVGDLSMLGHSDPQVTAAAVSEYVITCSDCQQEFSRLGVVYTNSHANPYSLLTTKPVTKPEDLRGIRMRTATPQHARWVESMGGRGVSMPTGEAFEALSQRIVEGTVASISDVISFNLGDVISHITLLDMGTFHSLSNHSIRNTLWAGLSIEDREALMMASIVSNIRTTSRWQEMVEEASIVARNKGIELLEPSDELIKASNEFKERDLLTAASSAEDRFGVIGAEEKIERFQALVEKWEGLLAQTDGSEAAIVALYRSEILDKIDLANYGL